MMKYKNRSAQGFSVQMVLMVILGVVLLGVGLGLFGTIFSQGDDFTQDLSRSLKTNLDSNYCQGDKFLCSPVIVLRGKDSDISFITVVNLYDENSEFNLNVNYVGTKGELESSCGVLKVQEYEQSFNLQSGKSAQIPIAFSKVNINSRPCSFQATVELKEVKGGVEEIIKNSKIPLIVRVE